MSRPEKPIDWERVDQMLEAGCLGTEIAPCFNLHPTTFYGRVEEKYGMSFTNYQSEKKAKGDAILRECQFENARKGNTVMQIWLGKQRLNQTEKVEKPVISAEAEIALKRLQECLFPPQASAKDKESSEDHTD